MNAPRESFFRQPLLHFLFAVVGLAAVNSRAAIHITGFSPGSGAVGTSVTLTGDSFSTTPTDNLVLVSGLRATVTAASATTLTATIPAGAVYGPFTVAANGFAAQSAQSFTVTFPTRNLDSSAFDGPARFSPGDGPVQNALADLDGDGRPDLAVVNYYANTLSVYLNSGTGSVAGVFSPKIDFSTGTNPYDLHFVDIDGDGKLDAVVTHWGEDTLSVFRNISTPGQISFASRANFTTGNGVHHNLNCGVGDLDGDGKPDVVVPSFDQGAIIVMRNISTPGAINFAPHVDIPTMANPHGVGIQDLDGDGKPDVVVNHHLQGATGVFVLRNVSQPGTLDTTSFQIVARLPANGCYVAFGDFDADGRADIVTSSWYDHSVTVFQNLTTGALSSNSFGAAITLPSAGSTKRVAVTDLDGDGRVDLVFPTELGDSVGIYRNIGGSNLISAAWFAPRVDLASGWNGDGICVGDFDLDGLPDIVFSSFYIDEVWAYRGVVLTTPSIITQPTNVIVGLGANTSLTVEATGGGLHYAWYHDGALVSGATAATLQINNAHGNNGGDYYVIVSNSGGSVTSTVATVTVTVERTLALGAVADVNEGALVPVPLTLTSHGDVGGMDLLITYDANYLALSDIAWDSSLDSALKDFSSPRRGQLRVVIALPATAIPAGTQTLATIQFRARTIIQTNVHVSLALSLSDMSDTSGNPIIGGTDVLGTAFNIHDVGFLAGDNNANQQLDIGDAALLMRLLAQIDSTRYWDYSANDFNLNQRLDSGDVIKMLRVIAGMDPPPQVPPPSSNKVYAAQSPNSASPLFAPELATISPALSQGSNGQLVTIQVRLDNVRTLISGASFTLDYPVAALRLRNAQSYRVGPSVPGGTLAVWNVAPDQTNFVTQNGHITLALSGSTAWAASNSVLAEFTFEVQPGASDRYLWPLTIGALQITGDGFNTRTLGPLAAVFVGRQPVSGRMTRIFVARGGDVSFQFSGDVGANYRIEYSDDLIHWNLLREVWNQSGPIDISDPGAGSRPQRFYRNVPF